MFLFTDELSHAFVACPMSKKLAARFAPESITGGLLSQALVASAIKLVIDDGWFVLLAIFVAFLTEPIGIVLYQGVGNLRFVFFMTTPARMASGALETLDHLSDACVVMAEVAHHWSVLTFAKLNLTWSATIRGAHQFGLMVILQAVRTCGPSTEAADDVSEHTNIARVTCNRRALYRC